MSVDIEELNRLHSATTHGELVANGDSIERNDYGLVSDFNMSGRGVEKKANAKFCAAIHNAWPAVVAELKRLRSRVAELETDPRLNVNWIRGIAKLCEESAEKQRQARAKIPDDGSRKSIVEAALSVGHEDAYATMHVELSGWADKFDKQVASEVDAK